MPRMPGSSGESVTRALARGLALLEAIAVSSDGAATAVITRATQLDNATVIRLLRTLMQAGYVARDQQGRYLLTGKLLRLASAFLDSSPLRRLARPLLVRLRDQTEETVHLGALDNDQVVYIDKIQGPSPVQLVSRIGHTMPVTTTALGKAIAAALDPEQLSRLLSHLTYPVITSASITGPEGFLEELDKTRARKFALDLGENQAGAYCVGAAIPGSQLFGETPLAISVSGPQFSMQGKIPAIGDLCIATAQQIAYELSLEEHEELRSGTSRAKASDVGGLSELRS